VRAIYSQTDDGIFFSYQLSIELVKHGERLAASFAKQFGKGAPQIFSPDFTKAADLMPSAEQYSNWVNMFVKRPDSPPSRHWWQSRRFAGR
jgi:hypothetical protein